MGFQKILRCFLLSVIIIPLLSTSTSNISAQSSEELNWFVKEGDSQTFIYTKYFNIYRDNPYEEYVTIKTENGDSSDIIYKKGISITFEIESVSEYAVRGRKTFNGNITSNSHILAYGLGDWVIRKSVNNFTYWKNFYKDKEHYLIENNLIIYDFNIDHQIVKYRIVEKWNWRTGWLNYYHEKQWNSTGVLFEFEFNFVNNLKLGDPSVNVIFGILLLFIINTTIIILRSKQKSRTIYLHFFFY